MNKQEHILTVLAEECNELAQACSKALRFGLHNTKTGKTVNNRKKISREFNDIYAMVKLLRKNKAIPYSISEKRVANKMIRFEENLELSERKGNVHKAVNYKFSIC